jgi:hypothetical protein
MRYKLAYLCFGLSSLFLGLGKMIRSGPMIVCDCLTLPGWFILDCHLIEQVPLKGGLRGFDWHTYLLPDEYVKQMDKLKRRYK